MSSAAVLSHQKPPTKISTCILHILLVFISGRAIFLLFLCVSATSVLHSELVSGYWSVRIPQSFSVSGDTTDMAARGFAGKRIITKL